MQYATLGAAVPMPQGALHGVLCSLSNAAERLLAIRNQLAAKVDEVLGTEPQGQTGSNKLQAVGVGGLAGSLTEQCEGLHSIIADIDYLLVRLQAL